MPSFLQPEDMLILRLADQILNRIVSQSNVLSKLSQPLCCLSQHHSAHENVKAEYLGCFTALLWGASRFQTLPKNCGFLGSLQAPKGSRPCKNPSPSKFSNVHSTHAMGFALLFSKGSLRSTTYPL